MLWRNFMRVAEACRAHGGNIAFEWPRGCTYWNDRRVRTFLKKFNLKKYNMDGCEFGLVSKATKTEGMMLKKPWRIASDVEQFWRMERMCTHTPGSHAKTQGIDTKLGEGYTDEFAKMVHLCWDVYVAASWD